MAKKKKWMAEAVKRPGAFTRKAKAAGMGVQSYARKVLAPGSGATLLTRRQAQYAKTAAKIARKRK